MSCHFSSYHRESGKSIGELRLLSAAVGGTRLGTVTGYDPATVPPILLVSFRVSIEKTMLVWSAMHYRLFLLCRHQNVVAF